MEPPVPPEFLVNLLETFEGSGVEFYFDRLGNDFVVFVIEFIDISKLEDNLL